MKILASSLSKRQRRELLIQCITIPKSLLNYLGEATTTRVAEAHNLHILMISGKTELRPKVFFDCLQDVYIEMRDRGVMQYGKPEAPKFNEEKHQEFLAKVQL